MLCIEWLVVASWWYMLQELQFHTTAACIDVDGAIPGGICLLFSLFDSLQNNTSWKPDACQDCTCHSDVVMCKATRCQNPQCDFQRVRQK